MQLQQQSDTESELIYDNYAVLGIKPEQLEGNDPRLPLEAPELQKRVKKAHRLRAMSIKNNLPKVDNVVQEPAPEVTTLFEEAERILSHPGRKLRYDAELSLARQEHRIAPLPQQLRELDIILEGTIQIPEGFQQPADYGTVPLGLPRQEAIAQMPTRKLQTIAEKLELKRRGRELLEKVQTFDIEGTVRKTLAVLNEGKRRAVNMLYVFPSYPEVVYMLPEHVALLEAVAIHERELQEVTTTIYDSPQKRHRQGSVKPRYINVTRREEEARMAKAHEFADVRTEIVPGFFSGLRSRRYHDISLPLRLWQIHNRPVQDLGVRAQRPSLRDPSQMQSTERLVNTQEEHLSVDHWNERKRYTNLDIPEDQEMVYKAIRSLGIAAVRTNRGFDGNLHFERRIRRVNKYELRVHGQDKRLEAIPLSELNRKRMESRRLLKTDMSKRIMDEFPLLIPETQQARFIRILRGEPLVTPTPGIGRGRVR